MGIFPGTNPLENSLVCQPIQNPSHSLRIGPDPAGGNPPLNNSSHGIHGSRMVCKITHDQFDDPGFLILEASRWFVQFPTPGFPCWCNPLAKCRSTRKRGNEGLSLYVAGLKKRSARVQTHPPARVEGGLEVRGKARDQMNAGAGDCSHRVRIFAPGEQEGYSIVSAMPLT